MLFMEDFDFYRKRRMNNLDGQAYVYKYIPLKYLLSMLKNKKLRIDKITTWEDPYENFFLKEEFYTYVPFYQRDIPISTEEISKRIYGQSWTLKEESDAMWRIYSIYSEDKKFNLDEMAIKIKVQVRNLFDLVYTEDSCMATTSIGEIQYKTTQEIEEWRNNLRCAKIDFLKFSEECLFMKRDSFQHEEEVRIIISECTEKIAQEFLEFKIPNIGIFEEYILDPRLNNQEDIDNVVKLISECGVEKSLISRSSLYDFFPKKIKL